MNYRTSERLRKDFRLGYIFRPDGTERTEVIRNLFMDLDDADKEIARLKGEVANGRSTPRGSDMALGLLSNTEFENGVLREENEQPCKVLEAVIAEGVGRDEEGAPCRKCEEKDELAKAFLYPKEGS